MRTPVLILTTLISASLFAAGHDLTTSPPPRHQVQPVLTGNGSGFTAAWTEPALGRMLIASSVVNEGGVPVEGGSAAFDPISAQSVAIAHSPTGALVAWIADGNVYAERLSPSGMPLNTILLAPVKTFPSDVAVAWNGSRYFVIWSAAETLAGTFVAPDGSSTTPQPFFTEPSAEAKITMLPDIAWDGRHFVVVFGERTNYICPVLCPLPDPDRFRVMRLSMEGDAIDSSPLVIGGKHLRAHVAASASGESLIALDSVSDVSTIVVHAEDSLTLDLETPVFRWVSDIFSAVVWDGATFNVGWRHSGADVSWLGSARVTPAGLPFDYRVTATGGLLSGGGTGWWGRPSMAVSDAGITAFAISDLASGSSLVRARLYLASELAPMPAPPTAPRNVVSYFGGNTARIDWQSDGAAGFTIEMWSAYDNNWNVYRKVPGDARTTTVSTSVGSLFRVRAFGPGGVSDGAVTSIGSMPRRRAGGR